MRSFRNRNVEDDDERAGRLEREYMLQQRTLRFGTAGAAGTTFGGSRYQSRPPRGFDQQSHSEIRHASTTHVSDSRMHSLLMRDIDPSDYHLLLELDDGVKPNAGASVQEISTLPTFKLCELSKELPNQGSSRKRKKTVEVICLDDEEVMNVASSSNAFSTSHSSVLGNETIICIERPDERSRRNASNDRKAKSSKKTSCQALASGIIVDLTDTETDPGESSSEFGSIKRRGAGAVASQENSQRNKLPAEMNSCGICMENYSSATDILTRLPCLHVFHSDCINKWLRIKCHCPIDNTSVF